MAKRRKFNNLNTLSDAIKKAGGWEAFHEKLNAAPRTPEEHMERMGKISQIEKTNAQTDLLRQRFEKTMANTNQSMADLQKNFARLTVSTQTMNFVFKSFGSAISNTTTKAIIEEAKARGQLSKAISLQASHSSAANFLKGIPVIGGALGGFVQAAHEYKYQMAGAGIAGANAEAVEGSVGPNRAFRDEISASTISRQLGIKNRYSPEQNAYQQDMLGIEVKQKQVDARQSVIRELERKAQDDLAAVKKNNPTYSYGTAMGSENQSEIRARMSRDVADLAKNRDQARIIKDQADIKTQREQAAKMYQLSFTDNMGTAGGMLSAQSFIASKGGAPTEDPMTSNVEVTNTTLSQIKDILDSIDRKTVGGSW